MKGQISIPKLSLIFLIPILGADSCSEVYPQDSEKTGIGEVPSFVPSFTKGQQRLNTITDATAETTSFNSSQVVLSEAVTIGPTEEEDQDNSYDNNTSNSDRKDVVSTHTPPVGLATKQTNPNIGYKGQTEDRMHKSADRSGKSELKQETNHCGASNAQERKGEYNKDIASYLERTKHKIQKRCKKHNPLKFFKKQTNPNIGYKGQAEDRIHTTAGRSSKSEAKQETNHCGANNAQERKEGYNKDTASYLEEVKHSLLKHFK